MAKKTQTAEEKQALLDELEDDVARVQVRDKNGQIKWRIPDEVLSTDEIQLKRSGKPITMGASPGRSPGDDSKKAAQVQATRQKIIAGSELVKTVKATPDSPHVLQQVLLGIAEETESLKQERRDAEKAGDPISVLSMRTIKAYSALATTWLERKKQLSTAAELDFDNPAVGELIKFVLETAQETMEICKVRHEVIDLVFTQLAARMSDRTWENEARRRLKSL